MASCGGSRTDIRKCRRGRWVVVLREGKIECAGSRVIPAISANGSPAFGQYLPSGPFALLVLNTSGGLGTANLPYTIYQTFYQAHDYGRASAAGVVVVIGTIIIATFALRTVSSLFREETSR